jgi:hypothetical protein
MFALCTEYMYIMFGDASAGPSQARQLLPMAHPCVSARVSLQAVQSLAWRLSTSQAYSL